MSPVQQHSSTAGQLDSCSTACDVLSVTCVNLWGGSMPKWASDVGQMLFLTRRSHLWGAGGVGASRGRREGGAINRPRSSTRALSSNTCDLLWRHRSVTSRTIHEPLIVNTHLPHYQWSLASCSAPVSVSGLSCPSPSPNTAHHHIILLHFLIFCNYVKTRESVVIKNT